MRTILFSTALTTTCLATVPVFADITPEQAWEAYQQMMSSSGMSPTADVRREGDTLIVRDMVYGMEFSIGDIASTSSSTIPEMRFKDNGDGTVTAWIEGPATTITSMPLDPAIGEGMIETRMNMAWEGNSLISGDPEDMVFTFVDNVMRMTSEPAFHDGIMIQPGLAVVVDKISGTYGLATNSSNIDIETDATAQSLSYTIEMTDPQAGKIDMNWSMKNLSLTSAMSVPTEAEGDFMTLFLTGYTGDITAGAESSAFSMDIATDSPAEAMMISGTSGATSLGFTMDKGTLGYDVVAHETTLSVGGAAIPGGQIDFKIAKATENLLLPLAASEDDQEFKVSVGLEGLVLPDIAWMIADPTGQLPHDPADLRLAFEGTVLNGFDLTYMEALIGAEDVPIQFKTLSMPEIYLSLAGATISGAGAGKFLDKEPAMPGGMPPFAGELSLNLKGVTDLITTLSSTGILPQEQAMSAQMMLGIFAVPGETPDELVSEIEMTEDGEILANGQALPF